MAALTLDPPVLTVSLQEHARRYVAARRRTGDALLEAVAELAAARQEADHGAWSVFLAAIGLDDSAARAQIRIHAQAQADPVYAERIRTGFLTEATARELLSAPPDVRAAVLAAPEAPTRAGLREAKREPAPDFGSANHKNPPDLESVRTRVRALGGSLSVSDGEYHLTIDGETRHSSQWSLIKEAVVKAETPAHAEQFNPVDHLPPLPADLAGWRWHLATGREGHRLFELLSPVPGILWRTGVCRTPSEAIAVARDYMNRPALVNAQNAPSAPARVDTPDRPVAPPAAPLVQPAATLRGAPDWREVADRAIRHLNWPPLNLDDAKDRRRAYTEARDLLAALASGLGYAPETVTTELAVQIGVYAVPITSPAPATAKRAENIPTNIPADIAARVRALGVTLTPAGDGCVIPHWPDERPGDLIGMSLFELDGWLRVDGPHLAGDRLAAGTLTLPGVAFDDAAGATAADYADVAVFLSDLAAVEAGAAFTTHQIRDLGDTLEGLAPILADTTYTALAERVTAVQGGA